MEQEVTGIVTTMFPTIEVIERTAKAGANFIIAHETPFTIIKTKRIGYSKMTLIATRLVCWINIRLRYGAFMITGIRTSPTELSWGI